MPMKSYSLLWRLTFRNPIYGVDYGGDCDAIWMLFKLGTTIDFLCVLIDYVFPHFSCWNFLLFYFCASCKLRWCMMVLFKVVNQQHCKFQERYVFQHFLDFVFCVFVACLQYVCFICLFTFCFVFLFCFLFFVHMFIHNFIFCQFFCLLFFICARLTIVNLCYVVKGSCFLLTLLTKSLLHLRIISLAYILHYASCEDWVIYIVDKCL